MNILRSTLKIMADKVIVLLVEGPTEIEFYKAVVKYAHDKMGVLLGCSFEYKDMHGIGNYKKDALRKVKKIQQDNAASDIYVLMCIDTDVFELSKKPPFDKKAVKIALEEAGVKQVHYIEARQSIEDWFLTDLTGVLSYLRLPADTKRPKGKGQDILKSLFKKANKIYVKGGKTEGFIGKLDISKIITQHCETIKPLCKIVKFDCQKICNKKRAGS